MEKELQKLASLLTQKEFEKRAIAIPGLWNGIKRFGGMFWNGAKDLAGQVGQTRVGGLLSGKQFRQGLDEMRMGMNPNLTKDTAQSMFTQGMKNLGAGALKTGLTYGGGLTALAGAHNIVNSAYTPRNPVPYTFG